MQTKTISSEQMTIKRFLFIIAFLLVGCVEGETAVTLSGGARLFAPQWSFDGRYLSMRVAGAEWGTAVLQAP